MGRTFTGGRELVRACCGAAAGRGRHWLKKNGHGAGISRAMPVFGRERAGGPQRRSAHAFSSAAFAPAENRLPSSSSAPGQEGASS